LKYNTGADPKVSMEPPFLDRPLTSFDELLKILGKLKSHPKQLIAVEEKGASK